MLNLSIYCLSHLARIQKRPTVGLFGALPCHLL